MRFVSVCSGIEAASCAWEPLGWEGVMFADIDPFASAVLQCRFPNVPNVGDFTQIGIKHHVENIDLLVGGTPCQDFSSSGFHAGLDGKRGQLTLEFVRLIERIKPRWIVWENVTGVLSNDKGRALGAFLGSLGECGYGFAYRVLDAQYFGVPQQRRRIFVVGHCGSDWRRAAAVLFEQESMQSHIVTSKKKPKTIRKSPFLGNAKRIGIENQENILRLNQQADGSITEKNITSTLNKSVPRIRGDGSIVIRQQGRLRQLTPNECEKLQGFPPDWTLVMFRGFLVPDPYRYAALGNSMAVPVMAWIGSRIAAVDQIESSK